MDNQLWSWVLSAVGLAGFFLAGSKVWWAWYVNIANQVIWTWYAVATEQWGFFVGAVFYFVVFIRNAVRWTKEHQAEKFFTETVLVPEIEQAFNRIRVSDPEKWGTGTPIKVKKLDG